mmetsp:Transcript_8197/g.16021  ORF Transcript_8197/g.16021 Transcript_8197/m.16021 type:complete len:156 (+) Transcript_8197:2-469(+)
MIISKSKDMAFYKNHYKEMKLFNKWTYKFINIKDLSLSQYIFINQEFGDFNPHSRGKFGNIQFAKSKCSIVERLINSLMLQGRNSGKKIRTINIVKKAFYLINKKTNLNPIQVLVTAVENWFKITYIVLQLKILYYWVKKFLINEFLWIFLLIEE